MLNIFFDWIPVTITLLGYLGIVFLMVLEGILFFLPSEVILPFAGYLVTQGYLNLWLVVFFATIGSALSSWLSYFVGNVGGKKFFDRFGKYLLLDEKHLAWSYAWFSRYGEKTIFFCRLIPVLRYFISFPAGMANMNKTKFFFYTFTGSFLWNLLLVAIGIVLGQEWERAGEITGKILLVIFIIGITFLFWGVLRELERRALSQAKAILDRWRKKGNGEPPKQVQ